MSVYLRLASLTKYTMKRLRRARKSLRNKNLLPTILETIPTNMSRTDQANYIIQYSDWLGADHCPFCKLQEDHCSCGSVCCALRKPNFHYSPQSGVEPDLGKVIVKKKFTPVRQTVQQAAAQRIAAFREKHQVVYAHKPKAKFSAQSGISPQDFSMKPSPMVGVTKIAKFADQPGESVYDVSGEMDPTRATQDDGASQLGDFFSRPVKIFTADWGTGTSFGQTLDPWNLYFTNPTVVSKLNNFKIARCKLHVKVVINGNGFQYGRVLVNYLPLNVWDDFSSNAFLIPEDAVQASQQPHLYLNPTTSAGGELVLPFFYYLDSWDVPGNAWGEMGAIFMRSLNNLKHANGASDKATISVFAWAEDMKLSGLTSLTAQSGEEIDEANMKGVISGPATAVSKLASKLENVPYIGKFAKATSIASGAVADSAKLFGYSRPSITQEPSPYRPSTVGNTATTTVPDTSTKLSVDDKQELSIDPGLAGLPSADPLAICNIATRESYLTKFDWAMGTPSETLLWNARVTPFAYAQSAGGAIHLPACAAAALPFTYWSGNMRYRFQFVASAFHKGRVQISYDSSSGSATASDMAVTYNRIVDLSEETDVTVEVGLSQAVAWIPATKPGEDVPSDYYSTTAFPFPNGYHNGVISLYVLNELTTPNSTVDNSIEVNVFISAGDDFEVASPSQYITKFVFKPQSGIEVVDGVSADQDKPQQEDVKVLANPFDANSMKNMVYFGEKIVSFRPLLKRYNHHKTFGHTLASPTTASFYYMRQNMFPYWRGNMPGAVDTTNAAAPYNYVNTTLMHWISIAHQAWRGGIRYKVVPRYHENAAGTSIAANRVSNWVSDDTYVEVEASLPVNSSMDFVHHIGMYRELSTGIYHPTSPIDMMEGGTINAGNVNPSIEIEIPFYSELRFSPGKKSNLTDTNVIMEDLWDLRVSSAPPCGLSMYDIFVAAAEDFQVYQWVGMPRVYYEDNPPISGP